jgi:hypothetical protein
MQSKGRWIRQRKGVIASKQSLGGNTYLEWNAESRIFGLALLVGAGTWGSASAAADIKLGNCHANP